MVYMKLLGNVQYLNTQSRVNTNGDGLGALGNVNGKSTESTVVSMGRLYVYVEPKTPRATASI